MPPEVMDLVPLATTKELKDILDRIKDEDEPDVQLAWLEHFFKKTRCPDCNKSLEPKTFRNVVSCSCGWELQRK